MPAAPSRGPSILFNATAIETGRRLVIASYRLKEANGIENAFDKLPAGRRTRPTGTMALWATVMLGAYLLLSYEARWRASPAANTAWS
jgi:hypothetical protein